MTGRWLLTACVLLGLGGCGDEPDAEPAKVPVPAISSQAPGPVTVVPSLAAGTQAGFVAVVQRELPAVAVDRRDEEIAALGDQACAALAAGRAAGAVIAEVRATGTDRSTARRLIRLAVETVCPDQDRRADEF